MSTLKNYLFKYEYKCVVRGGEMTNVPSAGAAKSIPNKEFWSWRRVPALENHIKNKTTTLFRHNHKYNTYLGYVTVLFHLVGFY